MPVHLTAAQARRLGIDNRGVPVPADDDGERRPSRRRRSPYHTTCHDCGEHFTTEAAESRHLAATRHTCYQLVLDLDTSA
jgi:hypothetical protein